MAETKQSRRERPSKPALSRAWIIAATIEIMRSEGLEKATMRRVAQELDTGQASLYAYVANTFELHAAVLDELVGSLPPIATEGGWSSRLELLLESYSDLLLAHPGLARSALRQRPTGPHMIGFFDQVLGLLLEGGIAADRAAWGADVLMQRVTSNAAEHSSPTPTDPDAPQDDEGDRIALVRAVRGADPATTPHIVEHADAVLAGPGHARAQWAVRAILAGIAATPTPLARSPIPRTARRKS